MPKDQIHYRPTPENLSWLGKSDNVNKSLNEIVEQARLANGGRGQTDEEVELSEIKEEIRAQEKIMRKAGNQYRYLNSRKEYLESVLLEMRKAADDRRMEKILKASQKAVA